MPVMRYMQRSVLPAAAFATVIVIHFAWINLFRDVNPAQERWVTLGSVGQPTWVEWYLDGGHYWMGYVYALSLGFAVIAIRYYIERRSCCARNLALGSVTFSGLMSVLGCFLLGCCGSPMLGVYLSILGPSFLPFAKPLAAGISTLLILGSYIWMCRKSRTAVDRATMDALAEVSRPASPNRQCNQCGTL